MRAVLVIGATGILAPAASRLSERGIHVVGISRKGREGTVAVDAHDSDALTEALADATWDAAMVYEPAVSQKSLAYIHGATPGRCVVVRTSAAADPARGTLVIPRDTLQLGWTADTPHRWHTPSEVSAAALDVLADGQPRTLGTVRPWQDRP
ncbi:hypothetical protein [Microbacterium hominis]|uniref:Uncharacterized protein n=1 Tax=Microbacterium hominis TaxID=162426 RepID=A0A7D4QB81_9MICO|nr:hypothetical protein [Microbacterium hominis]QKJ18277.1 hypothetical protein HQM25_01915 [Microbacterium hominis]